MGMRYLSHTRKVAALNLYLNVRLSFWSISVKDFLAFLSTSQLCVWKSCADPESFLSWFVIFLSHHFNKQRRPLFGPLVKRHLRGGSLACR